MKNLVFILFSLSLFSFGQSFYSKRINVANKYNQAGNMIFFNDTFYVTANVYEVPFSQASASLLKIDKYGNLFSAKRFKPSNRNYFGGRGIYKLNHKFYSTCDTDWGLQVQNCFYVFDENCDTVLTRSFGDTTFYNFAGRIKPFLKTDDKLLIFGITDSTCGPNHPGFYKPTVRVVDTNGTLHQTKIYTSTNFFRGLADADTTVKKGYVFCGAEVVNTSSSGSTRNYVIKLDSNLNQLWYKYIDTSNSLYSSIISLKSGQLLYSHSHSDFNASNAYLGDKLTLSKLDIGGNIIWRKRYGNIEQNGIGVSKVKELANGDLILCGTKFVNYTASVVQLMGWIMKTDSMGNLKWWKSYIPDNPIKDTITQNELHDIIELPNKDIVAVGWGGSSSFNSLVQQTWILKVDSNGCFGVGNCPQNIVSGVKESAFNETNLKVYPNPASDLLNIEIDEELHQNTLIVLTNSLGQLISNSIMENSKSKINIGHIPNGIYFITFKNKGFTLTKKLIIQH
jgi:hypothetical protein